MTHRRIAILGAGNGGCAAAADLGARGFEVRLYSRSRERLEPLRARGGIEYTGALGDGFAALAEITPDAGRALAGAELVVLAVPTHAHASIAAIAAPHLTADQIVLATPGHTVLLIPESLRRAGAPPVRTCETGSLPYICRMQGPARVCITQRSSRQAFAAFPGRDAEPLAALIRPAFSMIVPVPTLLDTLFAYTNAIHHPPAILGNAGRLEATGGDYYHYYDGISPAVGRLIDALDRERLAVAAALDTAAVPLPEHFFRMGYTTAGARASGSAYEVFHQSEPDRWLRAPATLDHRFLDEDVPFGLVPLAELGRLAQVPTPAIDHTIHLAAVATGRDYLAGGLTLARMGLAAVGKAELRALLSEGHAP